MKMEICICWVLILSLVLLLSGCTSTVTVSEYSVYYDEESDASYSYEEQDVQSEINDTASSKPEESSEPKTDASSDTETSSRSENATSSSEEKQEPIRITEFSKNNIEYIGRFSHEGSGSRFGWSGSTISAGFTGTELAVNLELSFIMGNKGNADYVEVFIDGVRTKTLRITKNQEHYEVASGLKNEYHYVYLVKRTEGCFSTLNFKGFDYLSSKASSAPARKKRTIAFLGDSITAGYGNMAAGGAQGFRMSQEDATNTYGYLAASRLNAEATIIACSGNGFVVKNLDPTYKKGQELMDYTVLNSDVKWEYSSSEQPDVLVINFGANDFAQGCASEDYRAEYSAFLEKIRAEYPHTYIICAIGTHSVSSASPHIKTVVQQRITAGDTRIASFKFMTSLTAKGMSGADNHPSAECHSAMAEELADFIEVKLGW